MVSALAISSSIAACSWSMQGIYSCTALHAFSIFFHFSSFLAAVVRWRHVQRHDGACTVGRHRHPGSVGENRWQNYLGCCHRGLRTERPPDSHRQLLQRLQLSWRAQSENKNCWLPQNAAERRWHQKFLRKTLRILRWSTIGVTRTAQFSRIC